MDRRAKHWKEIKAGRSWHGVKQRKKEKKEGKKQKQKKNKGKKKNRET